MAEMRAKNRSHVAKKNFGLPEKARSTGAKKKSGNYPMPDKSHAANAKARATQQLKKGNLSKSEKEKIDRKADKVLGKSKS
jgi:hypothetical protein